MLSGACPASPAQQPRRSERGGASRYWTYSPRLWRRRWGSRCVRPLLAWRSGWPSASDMGSRSVCCCCSVTWLPSYPLRFGCLLHSRWRQSASKRAVWWQDEGWNRKWLVGHFEKNKLRATIYDNNHRNTFCVITNNKKTHSPDKILTTR